MPDNSDKIKFEVVHNIPRRHSIHYSKYDEIRKALLALPPGDSLKVALGTFGPDTRSPELILQMFKRCGKRTHCRHLSDGIYMWLEEPKKDDKRR